MSESNLHYGDQIAPEVPFAARIVPHRPVKLKTVGDLLKSLEKTSYYKMLRTTSGYIADVLKVPVDELPINALTEIRPALRSYLKEGHYRRNSIRSYSTFASMLLRYATECGWSPEKLKEQGGWNDVLPVIRQEQCSKGGFERYRLFTTGDGVVAHAALGISSSREADLAECVLRLHSEGNQRPVPLRIPKGVVALEQRHFSRYNSDF